MESKKLVEESFIQKCQKAEAQLIQRKEKACQHNEKVAERVRDAQLQKEQMENKKLLEESFTQKCQKAEAQLTERKEKACQHNEKVAERVRDMQQQLEKRQEGIKMKLEQKKGSKVSGKFFSRVAACESPAKTNAVQLTEDVLKDSWLQPWYACTVSLPAADWEGHTGSKGGPVSSSFGCGCLAGLRRLLETSQTM